MSPIGLAWGFFELTDLVMNTGGAVWFFFGGGKDVIGIRSNK